MQSKRDVESFWSKIFTNFVPCAVRDDTNASKMVEADLVEGTAVYGHWLGEVHPKSMFYGKMIIHHGWIDLGNGYVLDPTRFVFEHVRPYLYEGIANPLEYDEGGNTFRRENMHPAPAWSSSEKQFTLILSGSAKRFAMDVLAYEGPTYSISQLFWLANLPLDMLGLHAMAIYTALRELGQEALVPMDNYRRVNDGRWP